MAIDKATTAKAVTSGTQLSSVGTVKTIVGQVKAVDANGAERVLQVGDKVYANETIITSADGGVIIEFPNGNHLDLPRSAHIMLDPEIYSASSAKPAEQEAQDEAARRCGAVILDPTVYLCDQEYCYGSRNLFPLYRDDDHLSEYGNKQLVPIFRQVFDDLAKVPVGGRP